VKGEGIRMNPKPYEPYTPTPKSEAETTPNPKPQPLNPQPSTLNPQPSTLQVREKFEEESYVLLYDFLLPSVLEEVPHPPYTSTPKIDTTET
jgi:hypothetical protein